MESTKSPKRVIKKRLKNVDKAIVEIAQMKFKNFEEKEFIWARWIGSRLKKNSNLAYIRGIKQII